jgi:hypothetical protein
MTNLDLTGEYLTYRPIDDRKPSLRLRSRNVLETHLTVFASATDMVLRATATPVPQLRVSTPHRVHRCAYPTPFPMKKFTFVPRSVFDGVAPQRLPRLDHPQTTCFMGFGRNPCGHRCGPPRGAKDGHLPPTTPLCSPSIAVNRTDASCPFILLKSERAPAAFRRSLARIWVEELHVVSLSSTRGF